MFLGREIKKMSRLVFVFWFFFCFAGSLFQQSPICPGRIYTLEIGTAHRGPTHLHRHTMPVPSLKACLDELIILQSSRLRAADICGVQVEGKVREK